MGLFKKFILSGLLSLVAVLGWQYVPALLPAQWTEPELRLLESLWLGNLPALPADPGNSVADNPAAAEFGHQLFFDTRLSATGTVSCATCHKPEFNFTDQLPLAVGLAPTDRNTMSLVGAAYSPWFFWDGRKDSLWSQALEPLENPLEHGTNRLHLAQLILQDKHYRETYENLFGPLSELSDATRFPTTTSPLVSDEFQNTWHAMAENDRQAVNRIFSNIGKALAAYQRKLLPGPAPFDEYVAGVLQNNQVGEQAALQRDEVAGLQLFINKAQCINCHNGSLFTNNAFHNTAVLSAPGILPALGRVAGLRTAIEDPFNCASEFSDAEPRNCDELRFARGGDEMLGAQRTASLRNLALTAPYMHAGQLATLQDVIEHYNTAAIAMVGHNEAKPLRLRAIEKRQLESFLQTLNGPLATDAKWLEAPQH